MRTTLTITQLIEQWINEKDVIADSRKVYKNSVEKFFLWCHSQGIDQRNVMREHIIKFKEYKLNEKYSTLTINRYLTSIRMFYNWCEANRFCDDPTIGIKNFKNYVGFKKYPLSPEQVKLLIDYSNNGTIHGMRNRAIIMLMYVNGLRAIEVSRMNYSDMFTSNNRFMIYIQGKGRVDKDDYIVLEQEVFDIIHDYLVMRNDLNNDGPMFCTHQFMSSNRVTAKHICRTITNILIKTNLKSPMYTTHSLRHGAATLLASRDVEATRIQAMMRHSNIQTTQLYNGMARMFFKQQNAESKMLLDSLKINKNTKYNEPRIDNNQMAS